MFKLETKASAEDYLLRDAYAFQLELYALALETMAMSIGLVEFKVAKTGLLLWNIHRSIGECKLYMLDRNPEIILGRLLRNIVAKGEAVLPEYAKEKDESS